MANLFEPNFRTFTNFQKKFQHTEITEKISECLIRPTLQSDKKLGVRKKIISYHKALFFYFETLELFFDSHTKRAIHKCGPRIAEIYDFHARWYQYLLQHR